MGNNSLRDIETKAGVVKHANTGSSLPSPQEQRTFALNFYGFVSVLALFAVGASVSRLFAQDQPAQEFFPRFLPLIATSIWLLLSVFVFWMARREFPPQATETAVAEAIGVTTFQRIIWFYHLALIALSVLLTWFFQEVGLLLLLSGTALAYVAASYLLSTRDRAIMLGLGALFSFLVFGLDILLGASALSYPRPVLLSSTIIRGGYILLAIVVVLSIVVRFRSFTLHTKLILSFIVISWLVIAAVTVISTMNAQQYVRSSVNQALIIAAQQTASAIDSSFSISVELLSSQAQLPEFRDFLSLPLAQRDPALRSYVEARLVEIYNSQISEAGLATTALTRQQFILSYLLVDANSAVLYDTASASQEGISLTGSSVFYEDFFQRPITDLQPYISPVLFEAGQGYLYVATPVLAADGNPIGVLVARYNALMLDTIVNENKNLVGSNSYPILMDENGLRLASGDSVPELYQLIKPVDSQKVNDLFQQKRLPSGLLAELTSDLSGLGQEYMIAPASSLYRYTQRPWQMSEQGIATLGENEAYLAAATQTQRQPWIVFYTQSEAYAQQPVAQQVRDIQLLALVVAGVASLMALGLSQLLVAPIRRLTAAAVQVARGSFDVRVISETQDELGSLSEVFNRMTDQLQLSMAESERRVLERTRDLEQRSAQFQAAAEVGQVAATIRDPGELMEQVVRLISDRFDFYHVGIFLIDETGQQAVLQAANSEGGQRMLARGHRLAVGQQGIVGYVTSYGQSRIALDVGEDAVYFDNPDLPETRSEMALPLTAGGNLLGALDIQSIKPGAFTRDDAAVMQVLADLIASSIENARLLTRSREALETTSRAFGELSRQGWLERLESASILGFRSLEKGVLPLEGISAADGDGKGDSVDLETNTLSLPIQVRDTVIGYLDTYKPIERGAWSSEEQALVTTLVDQIGLALESARLYETSQLQAQRERLVTDMSARLQQSLDVDAVLRTAAQEIRQTLGFQEVRIVLQSDDDSS